MDPTIKYLCHLEMVIWDSLPEGTGLTARQTYALMAVATPEQYQAALVRGVDHAPLILPDEHIDVEKVAAAIKDLVNRLN